MLPSDPLDDARRTGAFDQTFQLNGTLYVPFHSVPVAAGPFLPPSTDWVEQHLRLPPEREFCHGVRDQFVDGRRTYRKNLAAARIKGDSMIDWGIYDGYVILFQHSGFEYLEHGRILVVEKIGDEEGWGAWSLKGLMIEQVRLSSLNEFQEEIRFEERVVKLRSHNPRIRPWQLEHSGEYRIRGIFLRWLHPEVVFLMDSESLLLEIAKEKRRQNAE